MIHSMRIEELYRIAANSHGVVTRRAALEHGVADSTRRRMIRENGWFEPFPGTALLPGHRVTDRARMAAAVGYAGDESAITGWGAATLYGLVRKAPTTLQLVTPFSRRVRPVSRLDIQRSARFNDRDVMKIDGLPVVGASWMLADLAAEVYERRLVAWA